MMKINNKCNAISQSMDLFIIIAAVLAVGGADRGGGDMLPALSKMEYTSNPS
jgi:hypothetical protein